MPETDILNATATDPLNPDYGWQRKRPVTHLVAKANVGPSYTREITDVGHQFALNWGTTIDCQKSYADIQRLKRYYEQYRDGFFTIVDLEGTGRHYVGRFVTPVEPIPVGHNRWAAQNVLFEEVPDAPMVNYPSEWGAELDMTGADAIWRFTLNDFGELQPALDLAANWTLLQTDEALASNGTYDGTGWELETDETNAFLQYTYVGWGCELWAPLGPDRGIAEVYLDGVDQGPMDQYAAIVLRSAPLMRIQSVPLGMHTLKLVCTGTKSVDSSDYWIKFNALKVMR